MLIETDPVDWSKPIVSFDNVNNICLPALLVSTNYKTNSTATSYHAIVIYSKLGDKIEYVTKDGKSSVTNTRKIFNRDRPPEKELALTEAAQATIKGLGDF